MRPINEIIVHCSATRPGWWEGKSVEEIRDEFRRWHVEDNGWNDIGYHYVIGRGGEIAKGRELAVEGAHVRGHNQHSIGICLVGGHGAEATDRFADHFTDEQDKALRGLIKDLGARFGEDGTLPLSGHNHYSAKGCPGFDVRRWYENKPPRTVSQSSTLRAAAGGTASLVASEAVRIIPGLGEVAQIISVTFLGLAVLAFLIIFRERLSKWAAGVRL